MSFQNRQIFFDSTGWRSLWVYGAITLSGSLILGLAALFFVSAMTSPALPSIVLSPEQQYLTALTGGSRRAFHPGPAVDLSHARLDAKTISSRVRRFAFYVNWDPNSFFSLRRNSKSIDVLLPEWLHISNERGDIALDDARQQNITKVWLSANAPQLKIIPLINNYNPRTGAWLGEGAGRLLRSNLARKRLVDNVKSFLLKGKFAGIAVDFKALPKSDQPYLLDLIKELKAALKSEKLQVFSVLPAYETPLNYRELVEAVDQLILLAYDQHASHEAPGPAAGQGWFEALLDKRFKETYGQKLIVALGAYAIDWGEMGKGKVIPARAAWDILSRSGAKLTFDNPALNSTFSYRTSVPNELHTVWMLDGVTMYNQIAAALSMKPGGLALWRLGTEDPTIWSTFAAGRAPNKSALDNLKILDPGKVITYKGKGEILKFKNQSSIGAREVTHLPKFNLITNQSIQSNPQPMMISRLGFNKEKVIALTFDDGPSRAYTPAILDVLKKKNAKGSFFVVGMAAALEPAILKRIYNEGHDIGNHTFTHPDLSEIPSVQLDLELNSTQRVLESTLGLRSVLFRPPFVKDIEPATQSQARTLQASAALGYITIGQRIDPLDWGRPGVEEIVRRTVKYATRQNGNIVLLHDGGGNRTQTIKALPRIIDELRAKGFRFVTIHKLLGLKRNELMPRLSSSDKYIPYVNDISLSLARSFSEFMKVLFLVGIVCGGLRLLAIALGACRQTYIDKRRGVEDVTDKTFAVIVPAHNEERVIVDSLKSLLRSERKDFNILVIDDGSTDNTSAAVIDAFANEPRIQLVFKENGGKSSALNQAVELTDAEVVICIDADTRLAPDALSKLLVHFNDDRVGAVAGVVTVGNQTTLLARFQALEYLTAQSLDRRAFELVNGIGVVPGAIGAWRRQAVIDVGRYGADTYAEDADLTFKLERANWLVISEPNALAVTEVPETIREFNKQRFRWMFGTLQVAFKHFGVYFGKGAWGLKLFTIPNIFVFQFAFTLISPLMDALLLVSLGTDAWSYVSHGGSTLSSGTIEILAFWGAFQVLELGYAALGLFLHGASGNWRLLPLVLVQRFCYRQLIFWISLRTFIAALRGRFAGWGRVQRIGLPKALGTSIGEGMLKHAPAE